MILTEIAPAVKMPGQPTKIRVMAFIDGFNLYFGMRASHLKRYLWLDLPLLARNLLLPGQVLIGTKYFTSRVSGPCPKQERQSLYLDALGTIPAEGFKIFYGKYQESPRSCQHCGREDMVPSEKMTDVNIAVEMLADAFLDKFDTALLISADSDLCGPVCKIRGLFPSKRVVVAFPPSRRSAELEKVALSTFVIGKARLRDSQFNEAITTRSGFILRKPPSWS